MSKNCDLTKFDCLQYFWNKLSNYGKQSYFYSIILVPQAANFLQFFFVYFWNSVKNWKYLNCTRKLEKTTIFYRKKLFHSVGGDCYDTTQTRMLLSTNAMFIDTLWHKHRVRRIILSLNICEIVDGRRGTPEYADE